MPDYASNAHRQKEPPPEKVVEQVVTGEVIVRKKTFGQKFKSIFFGGDAKSALRYLAADVFLPTIRNLVVDATTKGMERMVYGESAQRRRAPISYGSRVQYNAPVRRDRAYLPDQANRPLRPVRRDTNDMVLSTREEAELVLERLLDIIDKYQVASLADLYDLTGLPTSSIDNKWGWTYLNNTEIRQVRDGFLLDLPPADEI